MQALKDRIPHAIGEVEEIRGAQERRKGRPQPWLQEVEIALNGPTPVNYTLDTICGAPHLAGKNARSAYNSNARSAYARSACSSNATLAQWKE